MHRPEFKTLLGEKFSPEEVQQIVAFLEKGFSPNGELDVASIFLYARECGKELKDVLAVCEAEWERNWNFQHPDLKGDPDAPGAAGNQNRMSLINVYQSLGIPNPYEAGKKIPKEPIVVKTYNSTYRIGPADQNGERTITRDGRPLPFTRGKVTFLSKGKCMQFIPAYADPDDGWTTSGVESIIVG